MKKLVLISLFALAACGGKSSGSGTTTPSNNSGSMGSGSMGGTSYGGASAGSAASGSAETPKPMMKSGGAGGDPCGG